ncbi:hypothetical protein X560_0934 [Listeria fleischmannii 1991]|jgi:hypothetical protein|uniref:Uncharacterized protein n=2 Tax=Listeria fleischmannii TaxID=1069827 RepID=A0A0J8GH13_9LIST|nr:hypothetical protein [Listeria fleischmannii]KMT60008.1 hypothetical protein X560_0934 [Listeria fleischmannii 1991]
MMMVYALPLKEIEFDTRLSSLKARPVCDVIEQESFYITLQDAIKREWLVRLQYFEEANIAHLNLAPFEDPEAFHGFGWVRTLELVPLELDEVTQEVLFQDVFGTVYSVQFSDIVNIELM